MQPLQIPLQRTPLLTGMFWLIVLLVLSLGGTLNLLWVSGWQLRAAELPLVALGILGAVLLKRTLVRLRPPRPVTFLADRILLPPDAESLKQRAVAYSDIVAVHQGGPPGQRHLVVESRRQVFYLPAGCFVEQDGAERLLRVLRQHILALPSGTALLEQTAALRTVSRLKLGQRPVVTQLLVGFMGAIFLNIWLKGDLAAPLGLLRWGALTPPLLRQGEFYRLLAASFLHVGPLHALLIVQALLHAGSLIERLLGWPRLLLLAGLGSVVGAAVPLLATLSGQEEALAPLLSVGAAPMATALLAAQLSLTWRLRPLLPLTAQRQGESWMLLGLLFLLPLFLPHEGSLATAAAALCGGLLVAFQLRPGQLPGIASAPVRGVALSLLGLHLVSLAVAVGHAAQGLGDAERLTELLVQQPQVQPYYLNEAAWAWACAREPTALQLAAGERAAQRAVAALPSEPALRDTLATLAHRRGDHAVAIAEQRLALRLSQDGEGGSDLIMVAQMARFLTAASRAAGPSLIGGPIPVDAWHLQLDRASGALILGTLPERALPYDVLALVRRRGQAVALVQLTLGAQAPLPQRYVAQFRLAETYNEVEIVYAQPSDAAVLATTLTWRVQPVIAAMTP